MRHPLTTMFQLLGFVGLILAIAFPMYVQVNRHTHPMQPNGWVQDERKTYPFAVTGAGFSGLCFLSAALVNINRQSPDRPDWSEKE
jgi:hypothetical protein